MVNMTLSETYLDYVQSCCKSRIVQLFVSISCTKLMNVIIKVEKSHNNAMNTTTPPPPSTPPQKKNSKKDTPTSFLL